VSDIDVGHTFIEIRDTDTGETTGKRGFYPDGGVSPNQPKAPGVVANDENHAYDVKKEYTLTDEQYENGKKKVSDDQNNRPGYDLNDHNCTDWALDVAKAAGQDVETKEGEWTGGGGHNPGDLGEDLVANGGERVTVCGGDGGSSGGGGGSSK
jgi:uncharacterized membrane protein YgcG